MDDIDEAPLQSTVDTLESTLSDIEKGIHFLRLENRLKTFKEWIYKDDDPCNKLKLAEAGFIYIGEDKYPDLLKCFFCHKELDGWERTDDPRDEHIKHSRNCRFIQLPKPFQDCTFNQQFQLRKELEEMHLRKFLKEREQYYLGHCIPMLKGKNKRRNRI